jgi:PAS domain S-box-containing protein
MTSRPLILHVDDNEAGRYATGRVLLAADFDVVSVATGAEALRTLEETRPDLVLLDVNLPDINGIEVCRRIKSNPATSDLPVLQLTASSLSARDLAKSLEGGADSFLREPIEPEALVAFINAALRAKRAEAALRQAAREWQTAFDAINSGLALTDEHGVIVRCNSALKRMLRERNLIGRTVESLLPSAADDGKRPFARMLRSRQREEEDLEVNSSFFHVAADPVLDESGALTGAVYVISDLTERQRFEEQIRQTQKLESIALLAGGIAHEFNNILTGVMGNASLMLQDAASDSETEQRLKDVLRSTERAAALTRQMLAYSGQGRYFIEAVDLSELIRSMSGLITSSVSRRVTLRYELSAGLPPVEADRRQLHQAILTLVQNASEAIGDAAGTVRIATGLSQTTSGHAGVSIEVEDTGIGMDERVQEQMFDPFFTTKFMGRGLGLSALDGIVRAHHGDIKVRSAPGEGSTFTLTLPAARTPSDRAPALRVVTGAVLVVDDEEIVLRLASAVLGANGYRVLRAVNGAEAVDVFQQHQGEIALVLLDMAMPVMGGEEALARLKKIRADVPVIVSTGYDEGEARRRFRDENIREFLQKPYTARQLVERIRAAMEAGV